MNTKNFFKAVACAMLMPAVLLTTSCSKGDDAVTNPEKPATTETAINKGYALPVTVNVTRQDDAATRAEFNKNDDNKLTFSAGDKLFVSGQLASIGPGSAAGKFAGTLDYVSEGTFSGTIYTHNQYEGTLDDLLDAANAILLPAGYEDYGYLSIGDNNTTEEKYDDKIVKTALHSFAASKKLAVEQLSFEEKGSYTSGTGFTLNPTNAILNFTVTGLAASTNVTATLTDGNELTIQGDVTTDAEGNATFAMGVRKETDLSELSLTVAGNPVTITSSSKELAAGKIYNITRSAIPGALIGQFSVSNTKKVYFSKGNLRYASGTWSFFDNQYDYYTSYSADAWDKFGWSTSKTTYGMNTSTDNSTYSGNFVDWGATIGTGWFTLSSAEWTYLFNTRSASTVGGTSNGRYAKAKVNNVQGIILFPDTYTHPDGVTAPTGVNTTGNTGWNGNNYSSADWTKMESAGCVFLPAAGYRDGSSVNLPGTYGYCWSATPNGDYAYRVRFTSGTLDPANSSYRDAGYSVRLVRQVE